MYTSMTGIIDSTIFKTYRVQMYLDVSKLAKNVVYPNPIVAC